MTEPDPAIASETRAATGETGLLAGVDEAGLGPILGPLVVAGVAMAGPRGLDPWQLLGDHVCRERQQRGKLRVADSKKVHQGKRGLQRLERTVLTFWGVFHGEIPTNLGDLLVACGADTACLQKCPWYRGLALPLPHLNDLGALELGAHVLGGCMADHAIELLNMAIRPMDVEEFNASIAATDNKSDTHFHAYAEVIGRMLAALPGDGHLVADRCGGRIHYAAGLRRNLSGWRVRTLGESPELSTYEIRREDDTARITFSARGEDRAFPTALASCAAKYVREMMMVMINDWFQDRLPELKRTAGYYVDGNRFLLDIGELLDAAEFPVGLLVRSR